MSTPSFYSAYELKIDLKHRLVVPAELRRAIDPDEKGASLIVTLGHNKLPWIYLEESYQAHVSKIPMEMSPENELLDYIHRKFGLASRLVWDDIGRVLLPEKILKKARIDKDVTLVGAGDHIEIWNRAAWDTRFDYLADLGELVDFKGKAAIKAAMTAVPPTQIKTDSRL